MLRIGGETLEIFVDDDGEPWLRHPPHESVLEARQRVVLYPKGGGMGSTGIEVRIEK